MTMWFLVLLHLKNTCCCELVAIATATLSNPTASVRDVSGNVDVTSKHCGASCLT